MTDRSLVLVVEDEKDLREALAVLIRRRGYRAETAANGQEALAKIADVGPPALILLDLSMPVMDGAELRERLLQRPDLADIPVVVISGVADLAATAARLQAADYLQKPIDFARLYSILDSYRK